MCAGKMNATVECNPLLGPMAFDAIKDVTSGKTVEKRLIVKDRLFDKSNAVAELPNRKY
jgi:simple sugar transport system substrate-binding protein